MIACNHICNFFKYFRNTMTSGNVTLRFAVHITLQEEIKACNSRATVYNKTVVENR